MIRISDGDDQGWDRYVDGHDDATVYHGLAWRRVIRRTFGKKVYYLVARREDGAVCGVLPLARTRSMFFGDNLVSLPYCNYGGLLADDESVRRALTSHASDLARRLGCDTVQLREHSAPPVGPEWRKRSDKVRMLLDLPATADELGRNLGAKRRSQIKRSRREGPEVRIGGAELLEDFYRVFCENMRDLGTPVYPIRFFRNVVAELGAHSHLVVVSIAGQPVAAAFLIEHRGTVEIPWASSLRSHAKVAVNMLLYWESLVFAIDKGFDVFDFGRCTRGEGTWRFKKQWGSIEHELSWQTHGLGRDPEPADAEQGGRRDLMRRLWSRLPLPVANRLGPLVTSNLPW